MKINPKGTEMVTAILRAIDAEAQAGRYGPYRVTVSERDGPTLAEQYYLPDAEWERPRGVTVWDRIRCLVGVAAVNVVGERLAVEQHADAPVRVSMEGGGVRLDILESRHPVDITEYQRQVAAATRAGAEVAAAVMIRGEKAKDRP